MGHGMTGVLLDTYVVNDLINEPHRLSQPVRDAILASTGRVFVSAATAMELAFHVRDGRTRFAVPVPDLLPQLQSAGIVVLPVTWQDFAAAVTVPLPHKDPFDRILAATALGRGLTMLTDDANIRACPGLHCVG
jgi:PIN domain nuclease of toxin-antitoxin system